MVTEIKIPDEFLSKLYTCILLIIIKVRHAHKVLEWSHQVNQTIRIATDYLFLFWS